MKICLARDKNQPLSRETAWGCLTANLAMPGFGSILAGRISGYPQAILGLAGIILTLVFGLQFCFWFLKHWARLQDPAADPLATLQEVWMAVRWAALGMGLFGLGWLWALASSLGILWRAKQPGGSVPPRL